MSRARDSLEPLKRPKKRAKKTKPGFYRVENDGKMVPIKVSEIDASEPIEMRPTDDGKTEIVHVLYRRNSDTFDSCFEPNFGIGMYRVEDGWRVWVDLMQMESYINARNANKANTARVANTDEIVRNAHRSWGFAYPKEKTPAITWIAAKTGKDRGTVSDSLKRQKLSTRPPT